jgi:hypothetical protein
MLRNLNRLLLFVLLCGIAPVALTADEPVKGGPTISDAARSAEVEPTKTGKTRDTLLYVRTDPPGATVFLNGKELGKTNGLFPVEPGNGTVLLELAGHEAGRRPVIIRANGITRVELKLAPQVEAKVAARVKNAAPPAKQKVGFYTESSNFANGDDITIKEVRAELGTLAKGDTVTVEGTYTLSSHLAATMLFSITTMGVSRDTDALDQQVQAGTNVPFEMTRRITCDGSLHLSFVQDAGGSSFGSVYFASKARARHGLVAESATSQVPASQRWYSAGPVWWELNDLVASHGIWLRALNHGEKEYEEILSQSKPGSTIVLLFALDNPDKEVPESHRDLLPIPWPQVEANLQKGKTVESSKTLRGRNIVLLAAPTEARLRQLIGRTKLLHWGSGSVPDADSSGTLSSAKAEDTCPAWVLPLSLTYARLATFPTVRKELKLTAEQEAKIDVATDKLKAVNSKFKSAWREAVGRPDAKKKMNEYANERNSAAENVKETLDATLSPEQMRRLRGLVLQMAGVSAVDDKEVQRELALTDDQVAKIRAVNVNFANHVRQMLSRSPQPKTSNVQPELGDYAKQLTNVLTADQQALLKKLKGATLAIPSQEWRAMMMQEF